MAAQISKCLVKDCKYNDNYSCKADYVEVRPVEDGKVVNFRETACYTFVLPCPEEE